MGDDNQENGFLRRIGWLEIGKIIPWQRLFGWLIKSGEKDDETLEPRVLVDSHNRPVGRLKDRDYVIFYNLRGEREVELCQALLEPHFAHFPVKKSLHLNMVTMIPYHKALPAKIAFNPEEEVRDTLSEVLSRKG